MFIIHTGDIHLDSRLTTRLSDKKLVIRRNEFLQAFEKMISYAKQHQVSAIVIAGDFFDGDQVTKKTKSMVLDWVRVNPEIHFYYACGNHDEQVSLSDFTALSNFHLFGNRVTTVDLGDITISGISLNEENRQTFYRDIDLPKEKKNIFVLHGQIESGGDEGIDLKKLQNKNITYLALGHLHRFQTGDLDAGGKWAYCGCLEGNGFDDTGKKGFVLLNVQEKQVDITFVENSIRSLWIKKVDITNAPTTLTQKQAITDALADLSGNDLVRVVLTGTTQAEQVLDLGYLENELKSKYFFLEIENQTTLQIDPKQYEHDVSLKGEFVQLVLQDGTMTQKQKDAVLRLGIGLLLGHEVEQ